MVGRARSTTIGPIQVLGGFYRSRGQKPDGHKRTYRDGVLNHNRSPSTSLQYFKLRWAGNLLGEMLPISKSALRFTFWFLWPLP